MTNLLDAQAFPAGQFGPLYHQRWRIEEAFKRIKHRLALEAVSGLTYLALQQDFAAKVLADNLCAARRAGRLLAWRTSNMRRVGRNARGH